MTIIDSLIVKILMIANGGRKCAKALLSKVALVGAVGWSSHQGQFKKLMRNGSISPTHFQLQCHVPQCFLHQSSHILRRCRKGPSISPIWKQSYTWALTLTPQGTFMPMVREWTKYHSSG